MSDFEDKDINKMFNELMSSNKIDDIEVKETNNILLAKGLLHIQESLTESILNINSIVYYLISDDNYKIEKDLNEILNYLYKISEDFIETISEQNDTIVFVDFNEEDIEKEDDDDTGNDGTGK